MTSSRTSITSSISRSSTTTTTHKKQEKTQTEVQITKCVKNTEQVKTLGLIGSCKTKNYAEDTCYCFMDACLEPARHIHIQECGYETLEEEITGETTDKITVQNTTDHFQTYDEILDELFGLNTSEKTVKEAEVVTAPEAEAESIDLIEETSDQ